MEAPRIPATEADVLVLHTDALLMREAKWETRLDADALGSFGASGGVGTALAVATGHMDRWHEAVVEEVGGWTQINGLVGLADWRDRLRVASELFDHVILLGRHSDEHAANVLSGELSELGTSHSVALGDFEWHAGDHGIGVAELVSKSVARLDDTTPLADIQVWLRLDAWTIETVAERLLWREGQHTYVVRRMDTGLGLTRDQFTQDLYLRRYERATSTSVFVDESAVPADEPIECGEHDWDPIDMIPVEHNGQIGFAILNRCIRCGEQWREPSNLELFPETNGFDPRLDEHQ